MVATIHMCQSDLFGTLMNKLKLFFRISLYFVAKEANNSTKNKEILSNLFKLAKFGCHANREK